MQLITRRPDKQLQSHVVDRKLSAARIADMQVRMCQVLSMLASEHQRICCKRADVVASLVQGDCCRVLLCQAYAQVARVCTAGFSCAGSHLCQYLRPHTAFLVTKGSRAVQET